MKIINLLPHTITDVTTGISYPTSGMIIRAESTGYKLLGYKDVQVTKYEYKLTSKLPEPKPNTLYIVSNMAMNAIPADRKDIVGPGPVEKDENGKPVGCRGFRRN